MGYLMKRNETLITIEKATLTIYMGSSKKDYAIRTRHRSLRYMESLKGMNQKIA